MSQHRMAVFAGVSRIGTVGFDSQEEAFSFEYDAEWRARGDSFSISPHILIHGAAPASGTVRRFLENLLPEGRALDIASTTYQVSKNNVYGLIRELGRETAGALTFLEEGRTPEGVETTKREVTRDELAKRIAERAEIPFSVWDNKVRLSIAGFQDKLAVYQEDGRMFLVEGRLASTHILKPEPVDKRTPFLVANEHFCMRLAARLDLPVAEVDIQRLPDAMLVVKRFDRIRRNDDVHRLHVIDACQALNVPVAYKYELNFGTGRDVRHIRDGVSFNRLNSLSDYTVRKAVTQRDLLRWAIFQYLIGNSDAHGKNVSFFADPEGMSLAPFYDLVSVVQHEGIDHEMAMAYGDEFVIANIRPYDWALLAQAVSAPRGLLVREMRRMARLAEEQALEQTADGIYAQEEREMVGRISAFVVQQARALAEAAEATSSVELD
jgi:serine/threonine-protein kinase HipA